MVRSRMARMIGLAVGQLVVLMMLTIGGASADAGAGSPGAAEGQSPAQSRSSVEVAAPSSGCPTEVFVCETVADLVAPTALAPSANSDYCTVFICETTGDLASVPTELAPAASVDYCTVFICETTGDFVAPAALASSQKSDYCTVFICETLADLASPAVPASSAQAFAPGTAWVAPGYADRVPTDIASAASADYCKEFVCETLADLVSPTVLTSAPSSPPAIMLADLPSFPKYI